MKIYRLFIVAGSINGVLSILWIYVNTLMNTHKFNELSNAHCTAGFFCILIGLFIASGEWMFKS